MANRLRSASKSNAISSLSLPSSDARGRYYSLGHDDTHSLASSWADYRRIVTNHSTNDVTVTTSFHGRQIPQRYKLLTEGAVQVCRVPHARNIIEKIRFSRFLRRWENHQIQLEQSEIFAHTVTCVECIAGMLRSPDVF
jgi:hypothetical protein